MNALNGTCWRRTYDSANPADTSLRFSEPQKAGDGVLLTLVGAAALAILMALTSPNAQIAAVTDSSPKPQPAQSSK